MSPDTPSLQTVVRNTTAFLVMVCKRIMDVLDSTAGIIWNILQWLTRTLWSVGNIAYSRTRSVLSGPVKQFVVGPLQLVLLGKRRDVSLLAVLLSPVLALVTAWWVGTTVGYETLTALVRGTWFGTDPSITIFLAVAGLLALGATSAGINSGLLPTSLLVSAPIFGAAVTRYGTTVTRSWGSQVVSLPNAVGIALLLAFGFGIPIAIGGFVLGRAIRHVFRVYSGRVGPSAPVENA